ncbi:MAG: hypothetical protein HYU64_08050 [Armatimonadetes bacterium]|nr:hypothetical protein [Armatimonadota bacterium]
MDGTGKNSSDRAPFGLLVGVFLVASGILALEIALTRIFSISLWYHFAFMSVGIAMLGLGAGGAFLYAFPTWNRGAYLSWYAGAFALSIPLCAQQICSFTADQFALRSMTDFLHTAWFYLSILAPFFLGGVTLSAALSCQEFSFSKLYSWDLVGTAAGCILAPWALSYCGAAGTLLASSALGLLAALAFPGPSLIKKACIGCAGLLVGSWSGAYGASQAQRQIRIPSTKALYYYMNQATPRADILLSLWSSLARVDVFAPLPSTSWGLSPTFSGKIPPQIGITLDGDAFTAIVEESPSGPNLDFLDYLPASLPYTLLHEPKTIVIGAGGGMDVQAALRNGSRSVKAVELNPVVMNLVKERFRHFSGDLYRKPRVEAICGEGRHYLNRSGERFDLVHIPLVDSWTAGAGGAYTLSENYLYTVEAFEEYLNHLSDNGILAINRWEKDNRFQGIKLCGTFNEAMAGRGMDDTRSCCLVAQSGMLSVFLFRKKPFSPKEIGLLLHKIAEKQFRLLYRPGQEDSLYARALKKDTRIALVRASPFDLSSATDDRPFFYKTFRWENFSYYLGQILKGESAPPFVTIFLVLCLFSGLFCGLFLILPLTLLRGKPVVNSVTVAGLVYFGCLGTGFMLCEVALLEKWILFLGHPLYATVIVLFSLLLFSGLGCLATNALPGERPGRFLRMILPIIALLCIFHGYLSGGLQDSLFSWTGPARTLVAFLAVAPLGFLLGMPFPLGISVLAGDQRLIPWAWGVNACLSVTGSVLSVFLASFLGFSSVLGIASLVYLGGLLFIIRKL